MAIEKIPSLFWGSTVWQYGFSSFQEWDTKLNRFLAKNQCTQRKLLYLVSTMCWAFKKCKFVRNYWNFSKTCIHWTIHISLFILGAHFLLVTFSIQFYLATLEIGQPILPVLCRGIFEFKHLADNRLTKIPLDGRSFHTFVT